MADVRIGGIFADFITRNARFLRGTRQNADALRRQQRAVRALRRDISGFNRSARAMVGRLVSIRGAASLLAGSGGLGFLIRRQAQFGASLVEASERTGVAIERLQTLRRVFQADGVEIQKFDTALSLFQRNVNEAAQGVAEYADSFGQLGINVEEHFRQGRTFGDLLDRVADGLAGLDEQYQRVGVARDLFGRQGALLLNQLQRGSDSIRAQEEAFARLGIVQDAQARALKELEQSYTDLATAIQVGLANAVAESADSFNDLNRGLIGSLPGALAGVINAVAVLVNNLDAVGHAAAIAIGFWLSHSRLTAIARGLATVAATSGVVRAAIFSIAGAVRFLGRVLRSLVIIEVLFRLVQFAIEFNDALEEGYSNIRALGVAARRVKDDFAGLFRSNEDSVLQPSAVNIPGAPGAAANDDLAGILETLDGLEESTAQITLQNTALRQTRALLGDIADSGERRVRDINNRTAAIGLTEKAQERLNAQLDIENEYAEAGRDLQRQLAAAGAAAADASLARSAAEAAGNKDALATARDAETAALQTIVQLNKATALWQGQRAEVARLSEVIDRDLLGALEKYGEAQERLAEQTANDNRIMDANREIAEGVVGIARSFRDAESAADGFREGLRSLIDRLLELVLFQPLVEGLATSLKSIDLSSFLGFGSGGGGATGAVLQLAGFAGGGLARPGPALVGERGAEVIDFRHPGRVYSNEQLGAALRGTGATTNVYVTAESSVGPEEVRAMIFEAAPAIAASGRSSTIEALRQPSAARRQVFGR